MKNKRYLESFLSFPVYICYLCIMLSLYLQFKNPPLKHIDKKIRIYNFLQERKKEKELTCHSLHVYSSSLKSRNSNVYLILASGLYSSKSLIWLWSMYQSTKSWIPKVVASWSLLWTVLVNRDPNLVDQDTLSLKRETKNFNNYTNKVTKPKFIKLYIWWLK